MRRLSRFLLRRRRGHRLPPPIPAPLPEYLQRHIAAQDAGYFCPFRRPTKSTPPTMKATAATTGTSYASIRCRCGHDADYNDFRTTPIRGELPRGHFQCPRCRRAWTVASEPPTIGWSGMFMPGKSSVVEIPASL